jgi:MoxR-like ATPase
MTAAFPVVGAVLTTSELRDLQRETDGVFADPSLMEYAVRLATATRQPAEYGLADIARYIQYGASPRASINLILTGRALALMRGRSYVQVEDVRDLALDVMRHRLVLTYEALSDGVTADQLVTRVLGTIPAPAEPLKRHVAVEA